MKEYTAEALSRHMSFLLRHNPQFVSIKGWASFNSVTAELSQKAGRLVSFEELKSIIESDEKGRYEISGERVRAVQGHSHEVDLSLVAVQPPPALFHGTVKRFAESIRSQGLVPKTRSFVHLSESTSTAEAVSTRRAGEKIIFIVDAEGASRAGVEFYKATNGVWLARAIPAEFLSVR